MRIAGHDHHVEEQPDGTLYCPECKATVTVEPDGGITVTPLLDDDNVGVDVGLRITWGKT